MKELEDRERATETGGKQGSPVEVSPAGESCFWIDIRRHRLVTDRQIFVGGTDEGPGPTELLVASLAASAAFHASSFLSQNTHRDLARLTAYWSYDLAHDRIKSINVDVEAPDLPPDLLDGLNEALKNTSVHNSLREAPEITIEITSGNPLMGDKNDRLSVDLP